MMKRIVILKPPRHDENFVNYENTDLGMPKSLPETPLLLPQISAEVLQYKAFELHCIDCQINEMSFDEMYFRMERIDPDLLIVPVQFFNLPEERKFIEMRWDTLGIMLPTSTPLIEVLNKYALDSCYFVTGDIIHGVRTALKAFSETGTLVETSGCLVKAGGSTPPKRRFWNFKEIYQSSPMPDFESFYIKKYFDLIEKRTGKRKLTIRISSGCPFRCGFCGNKALEDRRFFTWPMDYKKEVLDHLLSRYSPTELRLKDATFSASRKLAMEMLDWLHTHHGSIPIHITERVDTLDKTYLDYLKSRNVVRIGIGIESLDPVVQKNVNKKFSVDRAVELYEHASRIGLRMDAYLTIGLPGESPRSIEMMKMFIDRIYPQPCSVSILYLRPGSTFFWGFIKEDKVRHTDWLGYNTKSELVYIHETYETIQQLLEIKEDLYNYMKYDRRV